MTAPAIQAFGTSVSASVASANSSVAQTEIRLAGTVRRSRFSSSVPSTAPAPMQPRSVP